jgi:hypothetical protein
MRTSYARPVLVSTTGARSLEMLPLDAKKYSESWLQTLIHKHPDCMPVAEIEPGFGELVSVGMEISTKHGPIDNLLMTPDGDIVLVEVKLWRNPEARREVVSQALDYASCLFAWDYEELEQAVLNAGFGDGAKPARLYDLFAEKDGKDEAAFVDAVNRNLSKGRVLILVVGDGIRTEAHKLASVLQSHAGAHFTFALVELSVFQVDDQSGVMVCPRVLTQTEMIQRGVVEIHDRRTIVLPPEKIFATSAKQPTETITAEQFYDAMAALRPDVPGRLKSFIASLESLGVEAEFQRALTLRFYPPDGSPINLGTIHRDGQIWTDAVNIRPPAELSHRYIEDLAQAFGMNVEKKALNGAWHVRTLKRLPKIWEIADKFDAWLAAVERFTSAIRDRHP